MAKSKVKYMAVMPRCRKPKAVPASSADFYRENARLFYEVPGSLPAAKAREAIKNGFTEEAGIRLTWKDGKPLAPKREGGELGGWGFVPWPEKRKLILYWGYADANHLGQRPDPQQRNERAFWALVRSLRPKVSWRAILEAVNEVARLGWDEERLRSFVAGVPLEREAQSTGEMDIPGTPGLPVHAMSGMQQAMARSPGIMFGTTAPFAWKGKPHYRQVGFGHDDMVIVCAIVPEKHLDSIIPMARERAMGLADVQGWSLAGIPSVRVGRTTMFTDGNKESPTYGKSKRGEKVEIMFHIVSGLGFPRPRDEFC